MPTASVLTILASVFVLAITFHASVSASVESNPYVDSKNQFSINSPSGCTVDSCGTYATAVILYDPTDSNFRINTNLIIAATSLSLAADDSSATAQLPPTLT